jgi:type IV secretory pathway VirB4 component
VRIRQEIQALLRTELKQSSPRPASPRGPLASVTLQLYLEGLGEDIAVLSGREETVRLLDAMDDATLRDPRRLLAEFHSCRKAGAKEFVQ